ncbi:Lipoprotein-releasing system ATP-binding protein LolD [Gulosibacter molinativorax]|nr:Lipoprotein-releasing system ATP-binding protein LolD [Gulosibacter molinativorax]
MIMTQSENPTSASTPSIALQARGIEKTFFTTTPPARVLGGIDLDVREGEFVAVMGASGSGKSTLLYCISRMDRPTEGTISLGGNDLTGLSNAAMSRVRLLDMGFIFQQAHFLANLNVRDNILLPALKADPRNRAAVEARVDALLARFGIDHVANHGITQVSGGQLQRASICRALATEPKILFADEPTGALNASTTEEVMDALVDVHQDGTTIVMVTHDAACAARADRVLYLRDGMVVDQAELGPWSDEARAPREETLLRWLREHGF